MVDPISASALRALQNAQSTGVAGLRTAQPPQTTINQIQRVSGTSGSNAVQPPVKSASPNPDLPRGSLVDIVA